MENEFEGFYDEFWIDFEKDHQLTLKKEIKKGKKLDPVEYFYYLLRKLYKTSNKMIKLDTNNENDYILGSDYNEYIDCLNYELFKLKNKILSIYELSDFKEYSKTNKATILNNPNLFGISPFLFEISTREWFDFIENDIKNYGKFNLKLIEKKIYITLNNALERIGAKAFPIHHQFHWASEEVDSKYFYENLFEDLFEAHGDRILDDFEEIERKENRMFLNSFKIKNSIKSKIQINLSFELADRVFKKYFEINFTKERCHKIYPSFRIYLKAICNKPSMESEIKTIDLTEEEVKKMIGFFSCYKETKTSPNIFTYEVKQLVELMERISGLPAKTTWEKAHRDNKYKPAKNLEKEINSIIPEKSALIK